MPAVTFETRVNKDGSLSVPREVVDRLGVAPGQEVQGTLQLKNGERAAESPETLDLALKDLIERAGRLEPSPGKLTEDPIEHEVGEIIKEKYRRMGLGSARPGYCIFPR